MSEPFLGEIRLFTYTFEPVGWAFCEGQLLQVAQNEPLFALIGTIYGGDGESTFALPDLRGRAPLGVGPGSTELTERFIGQRDGTEAETLVVNQMPAHQHPITGTNGAATSSRPEFNIGASGGSYSGTFANTVAMRPTGQSGAGQPHNNMPPFLGLSFCIALHGIFPTRP